MKKILAILLMILTLSLLTACKTKEEPKETQEPQVVSETETTKEAEENTIPYVPARDIDKTEPKNSEQKEIEQIEEIKPVGEEEKEGEVVEETTGPAESADNTQNNNADQQETPGDAIMYPGENQTPIPPGRNK